MHPFRGMLKVSTKSSNMFLSLNFYNIYNQNSCRNLMASKRYSIKHVLALKFLTGLILFLKKIVQCEYLERKLTRFFVFYSIVLKAQKKLQKDISSLFNPLKVKFQKSIFSECLYRERSIVPKFHVFRPNGSG